MKVSDIVLTPAQFDRLWDIAPMEGAYTTDSLTGGIERIKYPPEELALSRWKSAQVIKKARAELRKAKTPPELRLSIDEADRIVERYGWKFTSMNDGYIKTTDFCSLFLERRPPYCNRGRWIAKVLPKSGHYVSAQDSWPRYYFYLEYACRELDEWLRMHTVEDRK